MFKKSLLYAIVGLLVFASCNKDEEEVYSPSGKDHKFFVIEDKPGEFNQLVYRIYTETGMPIFVNDTLGEEAYAYDADGNPITRVERFDFLYQMFGNNLLEEGKVVTRLVQSADTARMIEAAELIRDKVLPYIPKSGNVRPNSYFLVDSICHDVADVGWTITYYPTTLPVYVSLKGVVVQMGDWEKENKELWCARIIASKMVPWILENVDLTEWYNITLEPVNPIWKTIEYNAFYAPTEEKPIDLLTDAGMFDWQVVGPEEEQVSWGQTVIVQYYGTMTQEQDVREYVARVYAYRGRETEFRAEYAAYEKVIRKFDMMREWVLLFEKIHGLNNF